MYEIPSYEGYKNTLYRSRKKYLNVENLHFVHLKDVNIPRTLAEDFLVCDDGDDEKILIFCSKICRKIVKNNKKDLCRRHI